MTHSTVRAKKEDILNETTGDLRESTGRKFAFDQSALSDGLNRTERDSAVEIARLQELTKANKLDFLRKAETQIGTDNMSQLNMNYNELGGVTGDIPQQNLKDNLAAATSFVF